MPITFEQVCLRPEVVVTNVDDDIQIKFAHWEVRLPAQVVKNDGILLNFLSGGKVNVAGIDGSNLGILTLLDAQGCTLNEVPKTLTQRRVLQLFQPLRSELYSKYYSHPTWMRFRTGKATRNELTAWMIHNYHISRSAGTIAARMAVSTRDRELRDFFRQDSLEEYWHCDAFYFVEQAGVKLSSNAVKRYVPLPASTAFEEHALRCAEEDPLAHLLIAYFQESSIIFRSDSEEFYDLIEKNYEIPGAFRGWRRHMTLDCDHDHAGELGARFDDVNPLDLAAAQGSIRKVQAAHFFLMRALDQISAQAENEDAVAVRQPTAIQNDPIVNIVRSAEMSQLSCLYLLEAVRDASFRALAFARNHEQIMAAGNLASRMKSLGSEFNALREPVAPWLLACRNFLIERAVDPNLLCALSAWLVHLIADACPQLRDMAIGLAPHTSDNSIDAEVQTVRLAELLHLASVEGDIPTLVLGRL